MEMPWERRMRVLDEQAKSAEQKKQSATDAADRQAQNSAVWHWFQQQMKQAQQANPGATMADVMMELWSAMPKDQQIAFLVLQDQYDQQAIADIYGQPGWKMSSSDASDAAAYALAGHRGAGQMTQRALIPRSPTLAEVDQFARTQKIQLPPIASADDPLGEKHAQAIADLYDQCGRAIHGESRVGIGPIAGQLRGCSE